jgi:hypothetical protein
MTAPARMVKLAGYLGPFQLLLFKDGKKPHPTRPDEEVIVWKLLVQERDPERRPKQRQKAPTPLETGRTAAHRSPRQDARQAAAARFDEHGPDGEPGF